MMKNLYIELKKRKLDILIEIFALFIGLTAALWLDDYRDKKKEREFNNKLILDIRSEFKDIAKLDKEVQDNLKFVDTLKYFSKNSFETIYQSNLFDPTRLKKIRKDQNGKFSFSDMIFLTKSNFTDTQISKTSWEIFSNQNVTSLDYELIRYLSSIENLRKVVELQTNRLTSRYNLFKPLENYEIDEINNLLSNMQNSKLSLIQNTKEFLEKTKNYEK